MKEANTKAILAEVRRHLNGVVAQSLKEEGIEYPYSLGVQIASLRAIAKGYEKSMPVARDLAGRKLREAILMASLIADSNSFLTTDFPLWEKTFMNTEAVDTACFYCLSHTPNPWESIGKWLNSSAPLIQRAGIMTLAHSVRKGRELPDTPCATYSFTQIVSSPSNHRELLSLLSTLQEHESHLYPPLKDSINKYGSPAVKHLLALLPPEA